MNKTVKHKINKIESLLLTYYENPQLITCDEKMEALIFNRRMLLNQLFKPLKYYILGRITNTLSSSGS